jgi:hypothetical protein
MAVGAGSKHERPTKLEIALKFGQFRKISIKGFFMTTNPQTSYPYADFERITPSLRIGWVCDGQIAVFVPSDATRATVDVWVAAVGKRLQEWPAGKPYLALHDFSSPNVSVTPYARKRISELSTVRPEMQRYVAMLVSQTQLSMMLAYIVTHIGNLKVRTAQVFFNKEAGVNWLLERSASYLAKKAADQASEQPVKQP